MSVLVALIEQKLAEAKNLADLLVKAVDNGDITETDQYANELSLLINRESCLELPAAAWQGFLDAVRKIKPEFISSFLLEKEDMDVILAASLPDDSISVKALAEIAQFKHFLILELPLYDNTEKGAD